MIPQLHPRRAATSLHRRDALLRQVSLAPNVQVRERLEDAAARCECEAVLGRIDTTGDALAILRVALDPEHEGVEWRGATIYEVADRAISWLETHHIPGVQP